MAEFCPMDWNGSSAVAWSLTIFNIDLLSIFKHALDCFGLEHALWCSLPPG